jgi:hypothetical protein
LAGNCEGCENNLWTQGKFGLLSSAR